MSDERITRRLECLAMGEMLLTNGNHDEIGQLELDLRQTFSKLNLPATPESANQILVGMGRWTISSQKNLKDKPWPKSKTLAAQTYDDNLQSCLKTIQEKT